MKKRERERERERQAEGTGGSEYRRSQIRKTSNAFSERVMYTAGGAAAVASRRWSAPAPAHSLANERLCIYSVILL